MKKPLDDLKLPASISSPMDIFRILADGIPQIVWIMRPDGSVEYFNKEWTKYTGLPQSASTPEDWKRVTHPDDFERNLAEHRTGIENSAPIEREFRLRRSDGVYRWFIARSRPVLDADGKVYGRFGTATDIDDAKKGHAQFANLADSIPQIVWSGEPDGESFYYNQKWWDYTGLSRTKFRAEDAAAVVHPEDLARLASIWKASSEIGKDWEAEYRLRRHDGVYRWHLGRLVSVYDEKGKLLKRYGTATDIGELRDAVKIRDQFLAICSHELKTPLTLLEAHAGAFRKKYVQPSKAPPSQENLAKYFNRLDGHLRRLQHRINDMLDVSRIASGRLSIEMQPVDLHELTRTVIENLASQLETAGCSVALSETKPFHCSCDPLRIEQVITNLIENAIKYGGGKPIGVRFHESPESVSFVVCDEGVGVIKEDQERIFGQFERSANGTGVPGLGLGLYIASEIVAAHQGKITLESEPGEGACFTVILPRTLSRKK